jgi:hypothetical protein
MKRFLFMLVLALTAGLFGAFAQNPIDPTALVPDPAALLPDASGLTPDPAALLPDTSGLVPDPAGLLPDTSAITPDPAAPVAGDPNAAPPAGIQALEPLDIEPQKGIIPSEGALGERIRNGTVDLSDVILMLLQFTDVIIKLGGSLAVLMLIIGGIQGMVGGLTDDKEAAKKTIKWALVGLGVAVLSWPVVNFFQSWLTSV